MQQNFADVGITIELRNTSTPDEDAESGNFALMTQIPFLPCRLLL